MPKLLPSSALPGNPFRPRPEGDDYGVPDQPDWREVNWREHLRQVRVDGQTINFVDYGECRDSKHPVVFVHGLGGCWQNWLENIPRMAAEGRRVIALDLPGCGFSPMPDGEITISGFGQVVNGLCDELDLGEVVLVGNSMGGFTSAEVAIQFPERVERLVLNSAAGLTTSHLAHGPILAGARVVAAIGTRVAATSSKWVGRKRLRWPVFYSFIRYPNLISTELLYEISTGSGRPGFHPSLKAIFTYDYRERLPEIGCPALVVWGEDDMLVPARDADDYAELIPRSRKVVIEDTGHSAMFERPKTFNDLVVGFFDEVVEPPAREEEMGAANVRGPRAGAGAGDAAAAAS